MTDIEAAYVAAVARQRETIGLLVGKLLEGMTLEPCERDFVVAVLRDAAERPAKSRKGPRGGQPKYDADSLVVRFAVLTHGPQKVSPTAAKKLLVQENEVTVEAVGQAVAKRSAEVDRWTALLERAHYVLPAAK